MRHVARAVVLLVFGAVTAAQGIAAEFTAGKGIVVSNAWLRATPNGAKVAGGYVTIANTGSTADTLLSASIAATPTGEIHTMSMDNGVMHMGRLDKGLVIAPGATVTLKPGGDHLMFLNPTAPIKEGATTTGTLTFATAGTIPVTFAIGGMAAKTAPGAAASTPDGAMGAMDGMPMKGR